MGSQNAGISVFVQGGRLVCDYNAFGAHTVVESDVEVPTGESSLTVKVRRGDGFAGSVAVEVDGRAAGRAELPLLMRVVSSSAASVGMDHGSAVSPRYEAPFPFGGTLHELVVQASPDRYGAAPGTDAAHARAEEARQ
jgi:arylsulfatase